MIDTPKVLSFPGIDQPLREQTLAEFVMVLDEQHLVRRELRELQRRSAEAARLSSENVNLTNRIKELEADMEIYRTGLPEPEPIPGDLTPQQVIAAAKALTQSVTPPKPKIIERIPCRFCGKPIARGKAYYSIHLKQAHPQENAIDSPQE